MKKIVVGIGSMMICLAMTTLSFGIQLSQQGASNLKSSMNGTYVTDVKDGKISYTQACTAFSPEDWDTILNAYGLPEKMATSTAAIAYTPKEYNEIFTRYGLKIDPACIQATIGKIDYAVQVASDGTVTFGDVPTAFTGEEYSEILACYSLPAKPMVMKAPAKTEHWVMPSDTLFDFNKSVIKMKYYSNLDAVAAKINEDPSIKVEIQGNTDNIGSKKYNMALSIKRANAVRNYLVKKGGVAPSRLSVVGYGESMPIASNKTKEGRAQNRRVELKIIK
jgi:outer membrane protein OmpA-like peptidoglycan-associated protein